MNTASVQRLAANALSQFSSTVLGMAGGVILSLLVARALGPAEMGSYALALMVVTVVEKLAGLGLSGTALKFAAELSGREAVPPVVGWLLVRRTGLGLLAAAGLVVAAPLLGRLFHDPLLPVLLPIGAGLVIAHLIGGVLEAALEGASRFDLLFRATLVFTPLHLVATLTALALHGGAAGVIWAQVTFGVVYVVVLATLARHAGNLTWRPGSVAPGLTRRMVRFARHSYALSLLTFVVRERVEVLVLGALATAEAVGFYSVSMGMAAAAMRLGPAVVTAVFFPLLAVEWARAGREALAARYAQCLRYLALTTAPLALGGIAVAHAAVALILGPAYAPVVPVLRLTLVSAAVAALAEGPASLLTAAERQHWLLWVRAPLAAVNLALACLLVPTFAAAGAAWANLIVAVAEAFLLASFARRLGVALSLPAMALPFFAAGLAAVTAWAVLGARQDVLSLAGAVLAAVPVYAGTLAACRFFHREDAAVIQPLLNRFSFITAGRPARGPAL